MSVLTMNETSRSWRQHSTAPVVQLYLADAVEQAAELVGMRVAGFQIALNPIAPDAPIDSAMLSGAAAAVVQVAADSAPSVARFEQLARSTRTPLIAVAYDPPLALVRALIRAGAHDVVPLPLDIAELESSLAPIREDINRRQQAALAGTAKLISVIKSVGGVGATSLLGQLAVRFASHEAPFGRQACLLDLDIQFGDSAFQLGLRPKLSLADLIEAGTRLDGALMQATTTVHSSGLNVIASPPSMMPLEALSSEQVIDIVELAKREFGTVFVDLPTNWTNWSLSLLAQSDLVLLVTELSLTSLHRARRQLDLIQEQDFEGLDVQIVVNRFEKGLLRTIRQTDVRNALGRDIAFTIANDQLLMRSALDQGLPIAELKRKSALGQDIDKLDAGIAAALGLRR